MDEFVEKSVLKLKIKADMHKNRDEFDVSRLWDVIDTIHAADVAPVVHGKIVTTTDSCHCMHQNCSTCGKELEWKAYPNYCPDCGARLDGD